MHKAAEKPLSQQVKTTSGQQRSVLGGHVPPVLKDRTGDYSTYTEGGKHLSLVEYLKREPDRENRAKLGRHVLDRVTSQVKHQISRYKEILKISKDKGETRNFWVAGRI